MKAETTRRAFACAVLAVSLVVLQLIPALAQDGSGSIPGGKRETSAQGGQIRPPLGKGSPIREGAEYVANRVLVKFKPEAEGGDDAGAGGTEAVKRAVGASSSRALGATGIEALDIPGADVNEKLEWLRRQPGVEYAEPDYVRRVSAWPPDPDDPFYADPANRQWNLKNAPGDGGLGMPAAWSIETGSPSVVVAVLDSGVAYRESGSNHRSPDVTANFVAGYDFINNDPYADDDNGHGTHVAAIIAQATNNGLYCAGVVPDTTVMPVKVMDRTGAGTDSQIISGIAFAADRGVEVINLSLGGPDANYALEDACDYALAKNAVVVAASGNGGIGEVEYPAAYRSCVAVGATNRAKSRAGYSNYGGDLDIVAPGGDSSGAIYQVTYRPGTSPSSGAFEPVGQAGTSMATAHVSGVAALLRAHRPGWTAQEVRGAITSNAYDLGDAGWDPAFGWGLLDANAALNAAKPSLVNPAPGSVSPTHAKSGATVAMTVEGSSFPPMVKVILSRESEGSAGGKKAIVTGGNRVRCAMSLASAQPGIWDVTVESSALRSGSIPGGFVVDAADSRTWYLAEGSTAHGFEEFILLQNPNPDAAAVSITLMGPDGALDPVRAGIPANSRLTIKANDIVPNMDVSAMVTADRDIICERAMYWNNRVEGTDCIGVQSPSYTWHLAEGSTDHGYETFLLIQNPSSAPTVVDVTYLTSTGPVRKDSFTVDPDSRYTINVADDLPGRDMSFKVVADRRVIAERSMYWDGRRGGHASAGVTAPSVKWHLAEGSTGWGFTEYVLIENPNDSPATATLTYMTPAGSVPQPPVSLPAGTRTTVRVNDSLPSQDVSVVVTADRGVVAERAMYWDNGSGKAGHNAVGVPQARTESFLAEGSTDWGFEEWILVQNPNSEVANIGIDYMTESGLVRKNVFPLASNSRVSVRVSDDLPGVDTSARVYSNLPVIAERAMYWSGKGGGHASTGLMR